MASAPCIVTSKNVSRQGPMSPVGKITQAENSTAEGSEDGVWHAAQRHHPLPEKWVPSLYPGKLSFEIIIYYFLAELGLRCCVTKLPKVGAASSCGARARHRGGFSCFGASAPGRVGSVAVVHRLSWPAACGIFLDQGSNPCPLHWQVDSSTLWTSREVQPFLSYSRSSRGAIISRSDTPLVLMGAVV